MFVIDALGILFASLWLQVSPHSYTLRPHQDEAGLLSKQGVVVDAGEQADGIIGVQAQSQLGHLQGGAVKPAPAQALHVPVERHEHRAVLGVLKRQVADPGIGFEGRMPRRLKRIQTQLQRFFCVLVLVACPAPPVTP